LTVGGNYFMSADTIFLKDLEVHCIIGVNDWERMVKQPVLISYEIPTDVRPAAESDDVDDSINYKSISKWMIDFTEDSKFELVETLAHDLAIGVLRRFEVDEITLTVEKPGAVRHSNSVGVTVTRTSEDLEE
ncbi:MAG: dihydroneopterin aldolase, partial [bacterium]